MQPFIMGYDVTRYDFAALARHMFKTADLSHLGEGEIAQIMTRETDQSTPYHRTFYESFEEIMGGRYRNFVRGFVPAVLGEERFCYQRVPTFRLHMPHNVAVGDFHTDGDYYHQDGEVNFWLPLTDAWGSNTIHIEADQGQRNYRKIPLRYGEILIFDAVNWRHGNITNDTGFSRVSFDFRCINMSSYSPSGLSSVSAGRLLEIGDYFEVLP